MSEFLLNVATGVVSTTIAAIILLGMYAYWRIERLRSSCRSLCTRFNNLAEMEGDAVRAVEEIRGILQILEREATRIDQGILCLSIPRELALNSLCSRARCWIDKFKNESDSRVLLEILFGRSAGEELPQHVEFEKFLFDVDAFARSLDWRELLGVS